MYSRGIPVVQAKIQNGYKIYNFGIGDTVTDMVVRWSGPVIDDKAAIDQKITGTIVAISLKDKGSPDNHGAAVLDRIAAYGAELDDCALINDAEVAFAVDALLIKTETPVDGGDPIVNYIRVPVDNIYSLTEEPDETLMVLVGVSVVDGDDGFTPVVTPKVGQKLTANITCSDKEIGSYPVEPTATYKWYYKESPDTVLGSEPVYTYTSDNVGKTVCVDVEVEGYEGKATWEMTPAPDLTWPDNSPDVTTVI